MHFLTKEETAYIEQLKVTDNNRKYYKVHNQTCGFGLNYFEEINTFFCQLPYKAFEKKTVISQNTEREIPTM